MTDRSLRRAFCEKIRKAFDQAGVTLIELIVSMMVLSIIAVAVITVFLPMYEAYKTANNLTEVNTLLDNVSVLIIDDVAKASSIRPSGVSETAFTITTSYDILYDNDEGAIHRSAFGKRTPLFDPDYYGNKKMTALCSVDGDLVTITLCLTSETGWKVSRSYMVRPIGL